MRIDRLVPHLGEQILINAIKKNASDIHVEPMANRLRVRYRVDGVLQEVEAPPAKSTAAVISRVKIMAKLNIAERRLPQDGRIMHRVGGKELDLRVSTVPTSHGESVVMRILDRTQLILNLEGLNLAPEMFERYQRIVKRPYGMVLVTGSTGTGKSTSLAAMVGQTEQHGSSVALAFQDFADNVRLVLELNRVPARAAAHPSGSVPARPAAEPRPGRS